MSSNELAATIAEAVAAAGADTVFGMPGGGNNLDFIGAAEAAGLRFVLAHAETPAAMMASVYGDLTDSPGVCVVTRGPGAASAVNGVANAMLDRQPLVLVTDTVSAADAERIAHQRLDQRALYAPVTKRSATAGSGGDAGVTVRHTVGAAMSLPRGPVHLDFDPSATSSPTPSEIAAEPSPDTVDDALRLISQAKRPLVLLGVGARGLAGPVRTLLAESAAPTLMTYRAKGLVPDSWSNAAGLVTGATTEAPLLHAADLIVMIGVDTVEFIPNAWPYQAPVVSFSSWPETSPYLRPDVEVVGNLEKLVTELSQIWPATTWPPDAGNRHRDDELARLCAATPGTPEGVTPQEVVLRTRAAVPTGTIATVDAGAHMLPATSLWTTEDVDELIISSGLATMGFAVPAAVAAALARPSRRIVCFTGDGGLGMCLGELETISRLGLNVTIVVFNDSRLSLIAIKAKPDGNGGENAIGYGETDFAQIGRGYGLAGFSADSADELDTALARALGQHGPSIVDVRVDSRAYGEVLAAIRGKR
ncbi:thiamine pyrophosphate-binding protein [Saccharopolyspora sp. ASAGF58]|uniref:thiamine pyrophosphate-binding protein n=1 Tax=Saccharopolyspora sp. ASAGF58 TaxID=2719023 RepID=UPI0014476709|nr:thiamine pyrophosphate-binding protein [Saccharopolyspora sp. ASAGF58]